MPRILKQIDEINPDVLCLQEARKVEAEAFKNELETRGYAIVLSPINDTPLAATLITAYKKDTFIADETKCWWYNDEQSPDIQGGNAWYKWGRILTAVSLHKLKNGVKDETSEPLVVSNTHLGVARDEKTFSIHLALKLLERFQQQKIVWCGDFNFFADDGGVEHKKLITDAGYQDCLQHPKDEDGNQLSGTFVGYSVDKFAPQTKSTLSLLDGIFTKNIEAQAATCMVAVELTEDLSNRDLLPSDHFPIYTKVTC
jgi:endonuclease/exonuclease/phosphatase family metal-dependent hydrolase